MEHAQQLAARPQARAGRPPERGAAVQAPPGNIALTMKHAAALAAAPEFRQGIALTTEQAQALAKSPAVHAGIAMTLEESVALAEATQKNAAIALTMDDALALARSPGARAGLELYDRSSPDLMTNQRLSPEAVKAALAGHPVFALQGGGPSGPSSGPQQPSAGQFGKPAVTQLPPIKTPLWFYNALWTGYDATSASGDFVDIGAGGGMVWAVSSDGQLWRLPPGASKFVEEPSMQAAARVAVLSDGRPVVVTRFGSIEKLHYPDPNNEQFEWITLWQYPMESVPGAPYPTLPRDVAAGQGIDWLGTGVSERGERFFGSCGLIRSNGKVKHPSSDAVVAETTDMRKPRGGG